MAEDSPAAAREEELTATKAELATLVAAAEEALVQMDVLASQVSVRSTSRKIEQPAGDHGG